MFTAFTYITGPEGQSVGSLNVDPEAMSLILACSHTFVEFDHEIISTVILLLLLIQQGLCQLQAKGMCTTRESVISLTDYSDMT